MYWHDTCSVWIQLRSLRIFRTSKVLHLTVTRCVARMWLNSDGPFLVRHTPKIQNERLFTSRTSTRTLDLLHRCCEVYQAPGVLPPLEENEVDELILEERGLNQQRTTGLYFPNAKNNTQVESPLYGSDQTTGPVRSTWWPFDRISDHSMDGYLKLIRGLRR